MKQIAKVIVSVMLMLAVSACANTDATSQVFSNYEYAPAASFNNYPANAGYGYVGSHVASPFSMNNHY